MDVGERSVPRRDRFTFRRGTPGTKYRKAGWASGPGWTLQRREQPLAFAGNRNKRCG